MELFNGNGWRWQDNRSSIGHSNRNLVAEQTEIAVSPRNDPALSCHILPRMLDRTVHYCRWIRPDGYGIYNDISHRYTTNSSYSECRLVILVFKSSCGFSVVQHGWDSIRPVAARNRTARVEEWCASWPWTIRKVDEINCAIKADGPTLTC